MLVSIGFVRLSLQLQSREVRTGSQDNPPTASGAFGLGSKTHRSFYKLANTLRNADQKVGRWLLHGYNLHDALRRLFSCSLALGLKAPFRTEAARPV